jgi:SWIM/SEC-C metal-binding protein
MAKIFQKGPVLKQGERSKSNFEIKNALRLGSKKAPAQISVQTAERETELAAIFAENGWDCEIEVNADVDENIRDLETLQSTPVRSVTSKVASRNDPCPCGSGKKYKKCCGA